jgi:hypothetical protein
LRQNFNRSQVNQNLKNKAKQRHTTVLKEMLVSKFLSRNNIDLSVVLSLLTENSSEEKKILLKK